MKKIQLSISIFLIASFFLYNATADTAVSYKQSRDQMIKERAASKNDPKFSEAEIRLMNDAMNAVIQKHPSPGLKVGQKAPEFSLMNAHGKMVSLSSYLKKGPVVLVFYRGAWCPFCNLHLHALKNSISAFRQYGASVIAVTPQQPDQSLRQVRKDKYPFEILSDLDDKVMKSYGLYYRLSDELVALYKRKGLDVEMFNGRGRVGLPVPGTFVIGKDGVIKAVHAEHDYKERMEPADIVKALQKQDG